MQRNPMSSSIRVLIKFFSPHPLFLVNYLEKKYYQILVHFHNIFVVQSLLKDEAILKTILLFCEAEDEGRP